MFYLGNFILQCGLSVFRAIGYFGGYKLQAPKTKFQTKLISGMKSSTPFWSLVIENWNLFVIWSL